MFRIGFWDVVRTTLFAWFWSLDPAHSIVFGFLTGMTFVACFPYASVVQVMTLSLTEGREDLRLGLKKLSGV